jgi:hypothetical protein
VDEKTLIDEVMKDSELIPTADITDGYWTELRAEINRDCQQRSDRLWADYDWPWKKGHTSIVVTGGVGNGEGSLPATFQGFGMQMVVTVQGVQRPPLAWKSLGEIVAVRASWNATNAYPRMFSIKDETTAGVKKLIIAPYIASDVTLDLVYDKTPPVLVDSTSPSGLEEWPITYHRAVLKEMTIQERMRARGDVRADTSQERTIQAAIETMITAEMPGRGAVLRVPPHPASRRFYGRY